MSRIARTRRLALVAIDRDRRAAIGRRARAVPPWPTARRCTPPARPGCRSRCSSGRATSPASALNVDYQGIGSTAGRQNYMYNLIDFAATEIPYQPDELAQYHSELKEPVPLVPVHPRRRRRHVVHVQPRRPDDGRSASRTCGSRRRRSRRSSPARSPVGATRRSSPTTPGLNLPNTPLTPVVALGLVGHERPAVALPEGDAARDLEPVRGRASVARRRARTGRPTGRSSARACRAA